jgi:benzoyl-CoA reductase subunit D
MIIAGIDIGTDYTQTAIVDDGEQIAKGEAKTGFDLDDAVDKAIDEALESVDLEQDDVDKRVATGEGRKSVDVDEAVTTYRAIAIALAETWPEARTVLMMGAKNAAALKLDDSGNVLDFDENDKCAAGVGRFLSDLTRYLDDDLEGMIESARAVDEGVDELNTQCSVFAESEVISLIHEDVSAARIAWGVHEAIAERNSSLIRRVGADPDLLVVGGVGRNEAFLDALNAAVGEEVQVPENPGHVPALGAALSEVTDMDAEMETDVAPGEKRSDAPIGEAE